MSSAHGAGGVGPMGGDPFATLEALRSGQIQGREARLKAASNLMESQFFKELFKAMRDTVPDGGLLGGKGGEDAFTSLLDQHVADAAAARLEGGLGGALYRRLAGPEVSLPGPENSQDPGALNVSEFSQASAGEVDSRDVGGRPLIRQDGSGERIGGRPNR
jgi:Rod binding domain-containing protein